MCDVVSAGLAIASVAGTAATVSAQQKAAKDQRKYDNNVYSSTAKAANTNYIQTISQTNVRNYQEDTAAGQQAMATNTGIQGAKAQQAVVSGELGQAGNTAQMLLQDFDRLSAENQFTLDTNRDWRLQQTQQELAAAQASAQNATTGAMPRPVQMPSLLAASLQIGTSVFSAYDQYQQRNMQGPYNLNNR